MVGKEVGCISGEQHLMWGYLNVNIELSTFLLVGFSQPIDINYCANFKTAGACVTTENQHNMEYMIKL